MRMLGLDVGSVRIGIAVSDELGMLAREYDILSPKVFWEQLSSIFEELEPGGVVVGLPLNMQGKSSPQTQRVLDFIEKLKTKVSVPIEVMDERLSTHMAERLPGGHANKDSLAAQIILQNYLDKKASQTV